MGDDHPPTLKRLYLTVPEAGKLAAGLGRSASYAAARRGDIPTLKVNGRLVVPLGTLCKMYGFEPDEAVGQ